jgi:hypothetical protein
MKEEMNDKHEVKDQKMDVYAAGETVPANYLRTIKAGRLNGKSDINPQWRIRKLTELFGPCGKGWWITEDRLERVTVGNEIVVFAVVTLYIEGWPYGIVGHGGNKLLVQESSGMHVNDEAEKMALTDALSVACKQIGIGAAVYEGRWDGSKYADTPPESKKQVAPPKASNVQFLKVMAEAKKQLGEERYYKILGISGYEHSNEIVSRKVQESVFAEMIHEGVKI